MFFHSFLEDQSASHGKKGAAQFVDGKPVVPPKPGRPSSSPQATNKPQVNPFCFIYQNYSLYYLDGQ